MTLNFAHSNCRATFNVSSREPSSTTIISVFGHVCASADRRVSAIQGSALYAGIRIDTSGAGIAFTFLTGFFRKQRYSYRQSIREFRSVVGYVEFPISSDEFETDLEEL